MDIQTIEDQNNKLGLDIKKENDIMQTKNWNQH
ncbi:unnamed protein product [Callosobruchus maculatus]|uniref:Uncharacterized protein n=1 Tax=Callosobruchus maculatus TaxID=64391 RepID=A0A653BL77_CALMS|nr:unnamed protein product [Callosobruchus maculatus]